MRTAKRAIALATVFVVTVTCESRAHAQYITWADGYPKPGTNKNEIAVMGTLYPGMFTIGKDSLVVQYWRWSDTNKGALKNTSPALKITANGDGTYNFSASIDTKSANAKFNMVAEYKLYTDATMSMLFGTPASQLKTPTSQGSCDGSDLAAEITYDRSAARLRTGADNRAGQAIFLAGR